MFGGLLKKVINQTLILMRASCSPSWHSYSVWTRPAEQTSPSFDEPHFFPTCECALFTSLPGANRGRVSVSNWQKLISMDSTGKSHFTIWRPAEVRGSERSIKHHAYPIGP
jgi:hypothetical protein